MPTTSGSKDSRMTGAAGEHYVLCQLIRRGYVAAQAPEGVALMDIVASDQKGEKLFAIQVKTRNALGTDGGWHMKEKHEAPVRNLVYCFVDLGASYDDPVTCWVVPSGVVGDAVKRSHEIWARGDGKNGHVRQADTVMRRFLPSYNTSTYDRPGISEADRVWLESHSDGWLDPYRENWAQLDSWSSGQEVETATD